MNRVHFPWRPLGALLVEGGLLTTDELDRALVEQRRSGRLLGQVLVERGYVSGTELARALAEQHGVGLRPRAGSEAPAHRPERTRVIRTAGDGRWRPLGRVLVERGVVSPAELGRALAEQDQDPTRRLGEILVRAGSVSGPDLAVALAAQHGIELDPDEAVGLELETMPTPTPPGEPSYRVYTVDYEHAYARGEVLYQSTSFLEAADFACDYVQRENPAALEIEKVDGARHEPVWTYSEARASSEAAARKSLVQTFGFDPVKWDTRGRIDWKPKR